MGAVSGPGSGTEDRWRMSIDAKETRVHSVANSQTAKLGTSPANKTKYCNIGFDWCDSKLSTLIMHHLAAQQIHR